MKGIKASSLVAGVATDIGVPIDLADAVFQFYWDEVRKKLINPNKEIRIHLENLGDFVIKPWTLKKEVERFRYLVNEYPGRERIHQDALNNAKDRLVMLQGMLTVHEDELQRKEFVKQHKKNKEDAKIATDLGK